MALANNLKRAREVMQPQKSSSTPAKTKKVGGWKTATRIPKGMSSKIVPNAMSNVEIRKQNGLMARGAPQTNNSNA